MVNRFFKAGLLILLAALLTACAQRGIEGSGAGDSGPVGLYRARLEHPDGSSDRFKLLLYARLPDRLHGEVLSPVGGTVLIFDGGGDRLAVTYVRDRVTFAGQSSPEAIEKLIGIPITLQGLVRGLLTGEGVGEEMTLVREPQAPGLPQRLEVGFHDRALRLELKRYRPLRGEEEALGSGEAPTGMELRPLDLLVAVDYATAEGGGEGDR